MSKINLPSNTVSARAFVLLQMNRHYPSGCYLTIPPIIYYHLSPKKYIIFVKLQKKSKYFWKLPIHCWYKSLKTLKTLKVDTHYGHIPIIVTTLISMVL